jgi:hypothetical protein
MVMAASSIALRRSGWLSTPQLLRRDAEGAIKLARGILPGDDHGDLNDLVVAEKLSDTSEEFVIDIAAGDGHGIGVF